MQLLVRGHRKIAGQYYNPARPTRTWLRVGEELKKAILKAQEKYGEVKLIHGGAIGVDQLAAQQAVELGVPHKWCCPVENPEMQGSKWPGYIKTWINQELLPTAEVVNLENWYLYYYAEAMNKRNEMTIDMLEDGDVDICVWDGVKKGGTWNGTAYALDLFHPDLFSPAQVQFRMLRLNPRDMVWSVLHE